MVTIYDMTVRGELARGAAGPQLTSAIQEEGSAWTTFALRYSRDGERGAKLSGTWDDGDGETGQI